MQLVYSSIQAKRQFGSTDGFRWAMNRLEKISKVWQSELLAEKFGMKIKN